MYRRWRKDSDYNESTMLCRKEKKDYGVSFSYWKQCCSSQFETKQRASMKNLGKIIK